MNGAKLRVLGREEAGVKADSSGSGAGAAACRLNRKVVRAAGRIK